MLVRPWVQPLGVGLLLMVTLATLTTKVSRGPQLTRVSWQTVTTVKVLGKDWESTVSTIETGTQQLGPGQQPHQLQPQQPMAAVERAPGAMEQQHEQQQQPQRHAWSHELQQQQEQQALRGANSQQQLVQPSVKQQQQVAVAQPKAPGPIQQQLQQQQQQAGARPRAPGQPQEQGLQLKPRHGGQVPRGQNGSYVAICLSVKDEHCDIREWALHHASIGAGKLYIYDTQSSPPMSGVLDDLIASGLVDYHYVTPEYFNLTRTTRKGGYNWQQPVYTECLRRFGPLHRWMAFIDADEYIILDEHTASLPVLLKQYEPYGGLQLHWRFFSSGGHVSRPVGGVLRSYTACCKGEGGRVGYGSRSTKSVVQPRHALRPATVHNFKYKEGYYAVTTRLEKINGPRHQRPSHQGAGVYHYISRSLADFHAKMRRRSGVGGSKKMSDFYEYERKCNNTCTEAVPLGEALAAKYNLNHNVPQTCLPQQAPRQAV